QRAPARPHLPKSGRRLRCELRLTPEAKTAGAATIPPTPIRALPQMRPSQVANAIAEGRNVEQLSAKERIRAASARWTLNRERSADTARRKNRTSRDGRAVHSFLPQRTVIAAHGYTDRYSSTVSESFPQVTDGVEKVSFHATNCKSQHLGDLFAGQTF